MAKIRIPKKLIEVALPLDAINAEAAREKSIRHGHPSTLHLWWARRPLVAARAVLFAQLVNDPGGERGYKAGLSREQAMQKREELFAIIRDLVKWENINNPVVLERAHRAIRESWVETCAMNRGYAGFNPEQLPAFHDPFAGGGAIPLEAQRMGLESHASDLNPVAVMLNKAMIEIPPRFAGRQPVGPLPDGEMPLQDTYQGGSGLAEDVRRYGHWMRERAFERIGHLYPKVEITQDMATDRPDLAPYVGQKLTVIAWLWARTVKSPNPAFSHVDVPLVSSFVLSKKKDRQVYVQPVIDGDSYRFEVRMGIPPAEADKGTKTGGSKADFCCVVSGSPIEKEYIKNQGKTGKMGKKLMAIVCEGRRGRVYLSPSGVPYLADVSPRWRPQGEVPAHLSGGTCVPYGLDSWDKLFTRRQLMALNTFSDLVQEAKAEVEKAAKKAGFADDGISLADGGAGAKAYGEAIAVYLSFVIDKCVDRGSSICTWDSSPKMEALRNTFGRQAIPMSWDFAEGNPFSTSSGNFLNNVDWVWKSISNLPNCVSGHAEQADAQTQTTSKGKIISTDPPYYDNICYADLSDFFYVWLRRNLRDIYPALFATITVPKAEELVATPYRHGGKKAAEEFFMDGMTQAMHSLAEQAHPAFPVTIYYAFKASETKEGSTSNTGWEAFLEAVLQAGLAITGTWPMRTELGNRMIADGTNALASSIVLVCRKRAEDAPVASRRQFISELTERMPEALEDMTAGKDADRAPVAPVDLAQAAIGPGMEIFSKYKEVLKADGTRMSVHEAMLEINRSIADYLNPNGSDFDPDTQFCDAWYQQHGWGEGVFGEAEVLAKAKGTTVDHVRDSSVLSARAGRVQLVHWRDYPAEYDPATDKNRPIWEACHHLLRALNHGGEQAAADLLAAMPEAKESIRQLAYHLYVFNERRGNAEEARAYNELMTSWGEVESAIPSATAPLGPRQQTLDL